MLITRLWGTVAFVYKRQRHHLGLMLLALLGVILAVGLVSSASFFSMGVDLILINQELAGFSAARGGRSAFSIAIHSSSWSERPISLQAAEETATHVAGTLAGEIGLPLKYVGVQVNSGGVMLRPPAGSNRYGEQVTYLGSVELVYKNKIEEHLVIEGDPLDDGASGDVLDVWMHARKAEAMGIQLGEALDVSVVLPDPPTPIRVRGFWRARYPQEPFWFSDPDMAMQNVLLVRRQDYIKHVEPMIPSKTRSVTWHVILDEDQAIPANARKYLQGFERGLAVINKYLPDADVDTPPTDSLKNFVERVTALTTLLLSFNLPALGFLLYFLMLTSAIIARWQQREVAMLVSRGVSVWGILGITAVEELLLFIVGYPLGISLGMALAEGMGYTASFLSFAPRPPLPVSVVMTNVPLTLATLAVPLLARLLPAAQAAHHSVVESEREQARPSRGPFWYRYYLDFLLIVPTVYAYSQLVNQGTLAMVVRDRPEDLYRDPLLVLVPALFILTVALLTMRLFPLIMRLLDVLASALPWIVPHLALRQLGRHTHSYINPLILIIVSLALGVYTLSMAASLDQWLVDRMYYRVGADLAFTPQQEDTSGGGQGVTGDWIPLPEEWQALPGVVAATRVGDYNAQVTVSRRDVGVRFLALDRLQFPSAAWFRDDLAGEPLVALMNRLAVFPNGILVSRPVLDQHYLQIGDEVRILVKLGEGGEVTGLFKVVGAYKYFPTVYEEERTTFIGNLDYLSDLLGVTVPHRVWMRLAEGVEGQAVLASVPQKRIEVSAYEDARAMIQDEQAKTERVGIFGTLSVGFVAAVGMAAVGLLIYTYASLQERLYRFTILRAVGLVRWQIVGQVILEYVLLLAYGAIAGAGIGALASHLFVPFFRVTREKGVPLPPLLPIVAYDQVWRLALAFMGVMVLLEVVVIISSLSRRRFEMLREREG